MTIRHHEDLRVWQSAVHLTIAVHHCVETFHRRHAITYGDQIRRAAVSVAANIAEGAARQSSREFLRFLYIARGSCSELQTLFVIVRELNLANAKELDQVAQLLASTGRMLTRLIKSVAASL